MELDLSSFQSIKQFAANFTKEYNQLHYLINNAGVMANQQWEPSKDNYEIQFATNHLGHFYLTILLTNVLLQSKPSRVINVSSNASNACPNPFINHLKSFIQKSDGPPKESYAPFANYGISKASNILFSREYNRRYQSLGVTSVSLHPGVIPTDLTKNIGWMGNALKSSFARLFLKTVPQGAATTVRCVSLKDNEIKGGHFYKDCNEANGQIHQQFRITGNYNELKDDQVANDQANLLWQLSEKLITQKNFALSLNDNNVEQKSNLEIHANTNVTVSFNPGSNANSQVVEEVQN